MLGQCIRPGMLLLGAWLWAAAPAVAAPTIGNVSLRGLQAGGTTTLVIDGADLAANPRVLLSAKIASQTVKPGGTPTRATIDVALDAGVSPGIYLLRVATDAGVSNAIPVGIDRLPQVPFAPQAASLPVAMHGNLAGEAIFKTSLAGKKGQRLVVEVESKRLGANLNPVIHLYDPRGVQMAWAQGESRLSGDARIDAVLPADGQYTVELHDALFRGAAPGTFRLKIGELAYADVAFPIGVQQGTKTPVEFVRSSVVASTVVDATALPVGVRPVPWPDGVMATGTRPGVVVGEFAQFVEPATPAASSQTPSSQTAPSQTAPPQQVPPVPLGINGRIGAAGEEDRYRVPVTPGTTLRIDVEADRVGSALDGVLSIRNEQGSPLASNDDRPGTVDPGVDFAVPGGVNAIVVAIKDLHGRGGRDFVYRISVAPVGRPEFSLALSQDRLAAAVGGRALIRVEAKRAGYNGPIQLDVVGLPPGVTLAGNEMPAGSNVALVTLSSAAPTNAASGIAHGLLTVTGRAGDPAVKLVRTAMLPENATTRDQPWLREELAMAVVRPSPVAVDYLAVGSDQPVAQGSKLPVSVKVVRAAGAAGPIRLSLATTQVTPQKNVNNKMVDDPARALRLEAATTIAADKDQGQAVVLVPADLPPTAYDLVIQADLLSADGKQVVATSYTLPRRIVATPVANPPVSKALVIFEDDQQFVANLNQGTGPIGLVSDDKFSGKSAVKVAPDQRFNSAMPGLGVKIREKPGEGEYRYLRFAWKKKGGSQICLQVNHDGQWGPADGKPGKFRYHAGPGPESFGASLAVDPNLPGQWVVVTRDLFADFGEFTFTGLALSPIDGDYALYDHLHLGRTAADLDAATAAAKK